MISDVERYHGVVLRQILIASRRRVSVGVVDLSGRVDAFFFERAAFQIKYSSKRLSPWQFTYLRENIEELIALEREFSSVWAMLVCGVDGVLALSAEELRALLGGADGGRAIRVSRNRNSMYRVSGPAGELPFAKPRGVQVFVDKVIGVEVAGPSL